MRFCITKTTRLSTRVASVREKYLENDFFPDQGKAREKGNLERTWKVSGKLGKGKIRKDLESQGKVREFENKWLWQADFRKSINSV